MKNARTTLLVFFLFFLSGNICAQVQEKYSQVKIYPSADLARRSILLGNLEVDHFNETEDGGIICEISATAVKKLAVSSVKYEILIDDVVDWLQRENQKYMDAKKEGRDPNAGSREAFSETGKTIGAIIPTPTDFQVWGTFGGYYSFAQMETAMDNLVDDYPGLVQKISLGTAHAPTNRNIWCIKISDNVMLDEPNEPEVLYIGLQHAREAITGSSMIFFMQYLCEKYASDVRIQNLVNNRVIYIIPCMNPDGWEYNRTNGGAGAMWRKNRRDNPGSSFGVDLNRNWGVDWNDCPVPAGSCGSASLSSDIYWGPSVFSEPETQAIRDFIYTRNIVSAIDQHAFGPYYSLPFGRAELHTGADSLNLMEQQYYNHIPALMGTYNGMRAGNSIQSVGYYVAGGVKDWLLKGDIGVGTKGTIYGLTGEGGAGRNGTGNNFWPPMGQIENLCKGMTYQNLQMLYAAGSYVDLQDMDNMSVAGNGFFNFKITRIGIADAPVTVSLIPIQNVKTVGPPVTMNSLPDYYDTYTGGIYYTLPFTINNEQIIRYAWKIETGGYTYYDTVTKFYNPQVLLFDDMEGPDVTDNWTISGGGWNYSTDNAYQGTKALTESPGGNYSDDQDLIIRYNGSFNLVSASAAWLSFWTKHRAENFRDKLQVQISTNGTNWTAIAGTTTIQEPGILDGSQINGNPSLTGVRALWTKELFDLSNYIGFNNVRLRFQFTSGGPTSFFYGVDDGFYIDNLQVIQSNAALTTLPVTFGDVRGKLLANNTIEVSWEATVDDQHDYFEVEKSANGINFGAIGKVTGGPPYRLTDKTPLTGNNYYRIKQYNKNGEYNYSTVINVANNPRIKLTIYPNPLTEDLLTLKATDFRAGAVTIQITNAQGVVMYKNTVKEFPASGELKINTASWKPQLYILKIVNGKGGFLTVQKFIKQ